MKLFVKYKNGSVEIVNVSELSYHTKNPCLNCRKGSGCYDHGCFMPEDWGDFLTSQSCGVSIRLQDIQSSNRSFLKTKFVQKFKFSFPDFQLMLI